MPGKVKAVLRRTLKGVRKNLSADFRHQASHRVCQNICQMERYRHAKRIALYMHSSGEISLNTLWETAPKHGKYCYFPKLTADKRLLFLPATLRTEFKPNRYHILEPDVDDSLAIAPADLEVVFLPLLGFDLECNRLGMGAGYYDKTFAGIKRPLMVGVAYEFQHQLSIPTQEWDVPLDRIITEKRTYRRESQ